MFINKLLGQQENFSTVLTGYNHQNKRDIKYKT